MSHKEFVVHGVDTFMNNPLITVQVARAGKPLYRQNTNTKALPVKTRMEAVAGTPKVKHSMTIDDVSQETGRKTKVGLPETHGSPVDRRLKKVMEDASSYNTTQSSEELAEQQRADTSLKSAMSKNPADPNTTDRQLSGIPFKIEDMLQRSITFFSTQGLPIVVVGIMLFFL